MTVFGVVYILVCRSFFCTLLQAFYVWVVSYQDQDREGKEGARSAARDDPDRNQRGGNSRGDGEGEKVLPAADVRGQSQNSWISRVSKGKSFRFCVLLQIQVTPSAYSTSLKSTRSKSRRGWTCCRTSSSTSTRSASKPLQTRPRTRCFCLPAYALLLSSFFQDGLKAVENLKPSMEKLATDLHTVGSYFFGP